MRLREKWRAPRGTSVLIGAPANPMPANLLDRLREVVSESADVAFAYIPQMYSQGRIDPPRQVLYLVLRDSARGRVEQVMNAIMPTIHARWPKGEFIDVLPVFTDHPWLHDVIRTGCFLAANDEELHRRCVQEANAHAPHQRRVEGT